jgi:hypothetical protein
LSGGLWGLTSIGRGSRPSLGVSSQRVVPGVLAGTQADISDHAAHLLGKPVLDDVARRRTRSSPMTQA